MGTCGLIELIYNASSVVIDHCMKLQLCVHPLNQENHHAYGVPFASAFVKVRPLTVSGGENEVDADQAEIMTLGKQSCEGLKLSVVTSEVGLETRYTARPHLSVVFVPLSVTGSTSCQTVVRRHLKSLPKILSLPVLLPFVSRTIPRPF